MFSFGVIFDAANVVLEGVCERVIVGSLYCDIPLGLYIVRGENVVLIGELVITLLVEVKSYICSCGFWKVDIKFSLYEWF